MAPSRHYSKTPLKEAVIDIRIEPGTNFSPQELAQAFFNIAEDYPTRQNHYAGRIQWEVKAQERVDAEAKQTLTGFQFTSKDSKQILQARVDGFSFTRLAPYDRWETFSAEAHRLWEIFRNFIKPEIVTRIAVRYISQFDLPLPFDDLREYLKTFPEVSGEMFNFALSGYFMQLQIPQPDLMSMLNLTQAMVPATELEPNFLSVALDIDVFRDYDLPQTEEGIWNFLEQLRDRKNEIFEASITDKLKELIA